MAIACLALHYLPPRPHHSSIEAVAAKLGEIYLSGKNLVVIEQYTAEGGMQLIACRQWPRTM